MFKKIIISLLVIVGLFLVYVALQPSDMHISRELLIKSAPEVIFPYINNSKKANDWMPWAEIDPQAKMNYSGPEEGVGSTSNWDSSGQMGTGQAVVVESVPNQVVKTELTYTKPMVMSQLSTISLLPSGEGTVVRWEVTGKNKFVGRLFCVFMNMDKVVGGQFEQGLSKLKAITEAPAAK